MSWVATAVTLGAAVVGGKIAADSRERAAERAAGAQTEAAQLGIEETQRQFNEVQELLAPFVGAGQSAIEAQASLLGLRGSDEQQLAIQNIEESPLFESIVRQGEEGILQNAAATGGLRGGNVQRSLSEFRPQVLEELIGREFEKLGRVAQVGQSSAGRQAAQGQEASQQVTELIQQQGAAQAGEALAVGEAEARFFGDIGSQVGSVIGGRF